MSRPKLGFLALSNADSIDLLLESLQEIGWTDGQTFDVVFPTATQDLKRLEGNMTELLAASVDVIVAQTKPAIEIAARATRSIPIVMGAYNGDPVGDGLADSVDHPGGNVTGSFYNITSGGAERVDVLREFMPKLSTIGIVLNPDSAASIALHDELAGAARKLGLRVVSMPVHGRHDVGAAFERAKQQGVDGVVTVTAAEMFAIRKEVAEAQNAYRLPTVMGSIGYPSLGGLAKFGPEVPSLWQKMTPTIDLLLKKAASPGDLPLITVDGFQLDINIDAAKHLGLEIPESIMRRAVRIYPAA